MAQLCNLLVERESLLFFLLLEISLPLVVLGHGISLQRIASGETFVHHLARILASLELEIGLKPALRLGDQLDLAPVVLVSNPGIFVHELDNLTVRHKIGRFQIRHLTVIWTDLVGRVFKVHCRIAKNWLELVIFECVVAGR